MTRDIIATTNAPGAVGPYSQGIRTEQFVFTAGQVPLDPATGTLVTGSIEDQTRRALENVKAVLEAAGTGLDRAVKMTVFMTDLGDFKRMNAVYAEYLPRSSTGALRIRGQRAPPRRRHRDRGDRADAQFLVFSS